MSAHRNAYSQGRNWFSLLYHFEYFVTYSRKNDRYTYAQMEKFVQSTVEKIVKQSATGIDLELEPVPSCHPRRRGMEIMKNVDEAFQRQCHIDSDPRSRTSQYHSAINAGYIKRRDEVLSNAP